MEEQETNQKKNPYSGKGWIYQGLIWAVLTYTILTIWYFVDDWEYTFNWTKFLIGIPIWALAGLAYGRTMKWWTGRKASK